ncbi:ABC transporter [Achromobacter xylosoxidans]|jgi:multiple sugar transport system ATP-binding protein|uniref:ABC transporter ATP-binding protein n=3 Tax=Achromobacter TaxID=222 RepID=A0A9X3KYU6_ALCXX|nr:MULTISPECIES: ABC transporter ATP-binding protein [Achromobacter]MCZ8401363.1 ABC transporter ATP-binding protein [Achromobacter xylosoxidans]MCZ8434785.1 ABC transporter ATP-binding protein [Achromobacter ruhlandii]MDC6150945.1 ABC transporter ATP-binding protein [Achromobacter ruhlandii]MDD7979156.1 ABC transporter ATP-binding protein [Achromobacter ruhlandii]MDH0519747.1 ABC transporter ATP-binding protein [Achromobacter xylosoxidans]
MTDLVLDQISKSYGSTTVLDRLSLTIHDGEFLTLLGASGCGKSTLLKLLAGLEMPDSGTLRKGDTDILAQSPSERDCAMVFQSYALYPHMSVGDNICTPLYMRSLNFAQRLPGARWLIPGTRRRVRDAQDQGRQVAGILGIDHLWTRKPAQLSGGQRQRVALARAMVRRPSLFLFDEPLSNLDANLRQSLRSEIRQLHDQLGVTFVYVTHDQHEAMSMSDRVAVMKGGHILQLGTPQELYHAPQHADVAAFVGAPRINFLTVGHDSAGRAALQEQAIEPHFPTRSTRMAFRPHAATLAPMRDALGVSGTVQLVEFTGADCMVTLQTAGAEKVVVVLPASNRIHTGEVLRVYVPLTAWHAFDADGHSLADGQRALSLAA